MPYGFAPAVWNDLLIQVKRLRSSLEGEVDDDSVIEQATAFAHVTAQLRLTESAVGLTVVARAQ